MSTVISRRLRNRPITAVRFIRAVKYFFAERIRMPHDLTEQQVAAIQGDMTKPLLGTTKLDEKKFSAKFVRNLLRSMTDVRVLELHPWLLSSVYTFAYFVISRREQDSLCKKAYECMLQGETPTTAVIEHIVNNVILNYENLNKANNNKRETLKDNEIHSFRRSIQRSDHCKNELQVLAAWPEDVGYVCKSNQYSDLENEMRHYFKLFEINNTADLEDIEDAADTIDNSELIHNSENKNAVQNNVNKRNLRPRSNINYKEIESECRITRNKTKIINQESKDNSKEVKECKYIAKNDEMICRRSIPFTGRTPQKSHFCGPKRPIKIDSSVDASETNTHLINSTKKSNPITNPVVSDEINKVNQENSNKIQVNKEHYIPVSEENEIVKPVTNGTDNLISTMIHKFDRSEINHIPNFTNTICDTKKESTSPLDTNKKTDVASNDSSYIKLDSSKDINKKSNFNVIESANSFKGDEKLQSISSKVLPDSNADISMKDLNSTEKNIKVYSSNSSSKNEEVSINLINENAMLNINTSNNVTESNNNTSKRQNADTSVKDTSSGIKASLNNKIRDILKSIKISKTEEISMNVKRTNAKLNINAPNASDVNRNNDTSRSNRTQFFEGGIKLDLSKTTKKFEQDKKLLFGSPLKALADSRSNSGDIESSISATTTGGSTSKRKLIEVIDLESETCILNSNLLSKQSQKPPNVKKTCLISGSNSLATDISILTATKTNNLTSSNCNSDSKSTTVIVVDLDSEPTVINSKTLDAIPQECPDVKKECLDSNSNSCEIKSGILIASNNNFDSTSKRKSIEVIDLDFEARMNEAGIKNVENFLQIQQHPLQYQQQSCIFDSRLHINDNMSSSVNNVTPKFRSNVHRYDTTTNVGGDQTRQLPPNLRLSNPTVSNRTSVIPLPEVHLVGNVFQENFLRLTPCSNILKTGDQFLLTQDDDEYSNIPMVKILSEQQSHLQFKEKRDFGHCSVFRSDNSTSTLHNCLPMQLKQQQQQSIGSDFNCARINSTTAATIHRTDDVFISIPKVWHDSVNAQTQVKYHFLCDYCPVHIRFESAELLLKHVEITHNFCCNLCWNRYPSHQKLIQHMKEQHVRFTSEEPIVSVH